MKKVIPSAVSYKNFSASVPKSNPQPQPATPPKEEIMTPSLKKVAGIATATGVLVTTVAVGVLALVGMSGLPHYAAYQSRQVLASKDRIAIKEMLVKQVEFDSIKSSLKADATAIMMSKIKTDLAGNPFAGLAIAMVNPLVDQVIGNVTNPDLIARYWSEKTPELQCNLNVTGFGKAVYECPNNVKISLASSFTTWKVVGIDIKDFETLSNWK